MPTGHRTRVPPRDGVRVGPSLKTHLPPLVTAGPDVPRFLAQLHPLELPRRSTSVLIVGGGVAGLSAAIASAETQDTLVLLKGVRGETATAWAQGGMAVVQGSTTTRSCMRRTR